MVTPDPFTEIVVQDRVKIAAHRLGQEVVGEIASIIRERYEGRCSKYGYILPQSTHVTHVSAGHIETFSLHGSVVYDVSALCRVCNPAPGCVLRCTVMNMNDFGVLAVWGYNEPDTSIFIPVVEVVVPVQSSVINNDPEILRKLSIGKSVSIEILGKKFTYADRKINAIGRLVDATEQHIVHDRVQGYVHGSHARAPDSGVFLDTADLYENASDIEDEVSGAIGASDNVVSHDAESVVASDDEESDGEGVAHVEEPTSDPEDQADSDTESDATDVSA